MDRVQLSQLRFGLYVRKSTESDERQVESIDDQTKVMVELAGQLGLNIRKIYPEAHSAKEAGTRKDFYVLLDDLRSRYIDAVLCWNVDRLSRNSIDGGVIMDMLQHGVIKLVKTPFREYRPEDNLIVFAIDSVGATQHIVEHSRNVRRGLHQKADRGVWPGRARAGFRSEEVMINNRVRHRMVTDRKRFLLLRRAWEVMLTGSYTGVQVMRELNSWGYKSASTKAGKSGRPMSKAGMYRLFGNPLYYGCFYYKGALFQGTHEAMVSKAEFDEVQRILARENRIQPQKHEFPFTGLIRCGICGYFATAEQHIKHYRTTGNTRTYTYYHCGNRKNCRQSVTGKYIEQCLEQWLAKMLISPRLVEFIERVLSRDLDERPTIGNVIAKQREEALKRAQRRLDALFDMRQNGEVSPEEFIARKGKCQTEVTKTTASINESMRQRELVLESATNGLQFLANAYDRFSQGGDREKRQVATLLADEYTLTLGKLEIKPNPLLDLLRSIEPLVSGRDMVQSDESQVASSAMSRLVDHILTLVTEEGKSFQKLTDVGQSPDLSD